MKKIKRAIACWQSQAEAASARPFQAHQQPCSFIWGLWSAIQWHTTPSYQRLPLIYLVPCDPLNNTVSPTPGGGTCCHGDHHCHSAVPLVQCLESRNWEGGFLGSSAHVFKSFGCRSGDRSTNSGYRSTNSNTGEPYQPLSKAQWAIGPTWHCFPGSCEHPNNISQKQWAKWMLSLYTHNSLIRKVLQS